MEEIGTNNKILSFTYKNYRGEVNERHITPMGIWYGKTNYHPTQWLLSGYDIDKRGNRDFALKDILSFNDGEIPNTQYTLDSKAHQDDFKKGNKI